MNPLAAIWRYVKSFLYLITGQIDKSRRVLDSNPNVMKAKFDDIITVSYTHLTLPTKA